MKIKILTLVSCLLLLGQTLRAQSLETDIQAIREQAKKELSESAGTVYTVVFDNSGSMEGKKITAAKVAFQWWLASVPAGSTWSVYSFDDNGKCVLPFTLNGQQQAAQIILGFKANTNTPICGTLKKAAAAISRRRIDKPFERHVLLLFTDGEENADNRKASGVQQDIINLRNAGIEIVAIGYAGAGDYMNGYASRYYQANDQAALQSGLAQVQSEIDVNAPIEITPAEMEKLATQSTVQKIGPAKSSIKAPAPVPSARNVAPAPVQPARKSGVSVSFIVGCFFAAFLLYRIGKKIFS